MLKDEIIAELNMLVDAMKDPNFDVEELDVEIETFNFVLKVSIDRGLCECMNFSPMYNADICEECNQDRIDMQKAIDFTE